MFITGRLSQLLPDTLCSLRVLLRVHCAFDQTTDKDDPDLLEVLVAYVEFSIFWKFYLRHEILSKNEKALKTHLFSYNAWKYFVEIPGRFQEPLIAMSDMRAGCRIKQEKRHIS